jgi:hypothetical protein
MICVLLQTLQALRSANAALREQVGRMRRSHTHTHTHTHTCTFARTLCQLQTHVIHTHACIISVRTRTPICHFCTAGACLQLREFSRAVDGVLTGAPTFAGECACADEADLLPHRACPPPRAGAPGTDSTQARDREAFALERRRLLAELASKARCCPREGAVPVTCAALQEKALRLATKKFEAFKRAKADMKRQVTHVRSHCDATHCVW